VDEGIAMTAVARVEELAQAVRAGRDVRGYRGRARAVGPAGDDREAGAAARRDRRDPHARERGERRRIRFQARQEMGHLGLAALDLAEDAARVVGDAPAETEACRESVQEGPEAAALHDALEVHLAGDAGRDGTDVRFEHPTAQPAGRPPGGSMSASGMTS